MKEINYPLIGIISVESGRETNYIFTEEEFAHVSFHQARKIILQDEKKLVDFIHGKYNNTKLAKKNPDWYWKNVSALPPAQSTTFNDVVESLCLCRMNVFYRRNQEEIPFCRIPRQVAKANFSLPALDEILHTTTAELEKSHNLRLGDKLDFSTPVDGGFIVFNLHVTKAEYPDITYTFVQNAKDGGKEFPLHRDPLSEMNGEWHLYLPDEGGFYTKGYSIVVERELEKNIEEERA